MPCNDYTTKLLDMEHMAVKNIEVHPDRLIVYVEMERRPTRCPCCGAETKSFTIIANRR